jgi:CheY-like chemotaxis protein
MTKLHSYKSTILVIDDEATLCTLISKVLTRAGHRVLSFTDSQAALQIVHSQTEQIDCILVDLMMPKLGGEAVLEAVRSLNVGIPIVLMSGWSNKKILGQIQEDRSLSFLPKPFSINELRAAIDQTQMQAAL